MLDFFQKKFLYRTLTIFSIFSLLLLTGCGTKQKGTDSTGGVAVVKTATSQIGKKYRYGGESPSKGFDCSGLIWWSYKKHGITVPRVTTGQAKAGKAVSKKRAKPGDIVVFRISRNSRALHTGLYAGNNKFIHSPRTGSRVRMESLNSTYWKPKLMTVRRVLH